MSVKYAGGGSPFGGILDLVAAASMVVPGMQGLAPWVAGARAASSAARGDWAGAGTNALKSVSGFKGGARNDARDSVAAPMLTTTKDNKYNALLKRYENSPDFDTSGTRYQMLLRQYPWLAMNGSVNGKPWLGR